MDTLITVTGRDQAARGELDVKFASITDRQINYTTGSDGILDDLASRIYFEAASDNNDIIVYELDSKGSMSPFVSDDYTVYGGHAFDLTASVSASAVGGPYAGALNNPGSIDLVSDSIIQSSTENFKRQMMIGSRVLSKFDKNEPFALNTNQLGFEITNSTPIPINSGRVTLTIDQTESVFQDRKFGNLLNYRYLPPVTKPYTGALTGSVMASYSKINGDPLDTLEELEKYLSGKQYQEIKFAKTSSSNNILAQLFDINQETSQLEKLAIIDVGQFQIDTFHSKHLLFAGKLYRDSVGALTFVNIFTLVFE